jgi:outer membrane translocation and assembly module TamA
MLFNFEYRFPVWSLIDGVIFCDTGRVFHSPSDISFANMKYSAGGGLKIRIPNLAMFRFEAAYGGEESI